MDFRHRIYRAIRLLGSDYIIRIYGDSLLKNTLDIEKTLGMKLCYSTDFSHVESDKLPFCFVCGKSIYTFSNENLENIASLFFSYPSIFEGNFVVKETVPENRNLFLYSAVKYFLKKFSHGGKLICGKDSSSEIYIPEFSTIPEFKMKMEVSGI